MSHRAIRVARNHYTDDSENNQMYFNPYSARIDFSRQNLTSVDVRF